MLCAGKSGSNWLDRLRVSKGFPSGKDVDLAHFLNPDINLETDSVTETNDEKVNNNKSVDIEEGDEEEIQVIKVKNKKFVTNSRDEIDKEQESLFDLMSSVLSELFIMDTNSGRKFQEISSKKTKSGRKQKNPKPCVISNGESDDPVMSPCTANYNSDEEGDKKKLGFDLEKNQKWKGETISGYSRADVMIIDTSASSWKSDKWVFRKGNVWKVREKKSKCRKVFEMRKKRKSNNQSPDSENIDKKRTKGRGY
ncbi:hypothetical protein MKX01_036946 [Papaver californicum]|nr:hypothetical protein MKX01_036946 [Papaver californicum]